MRTKRRRAQRARTSGPAPVSDTLRRVLEQAAAHADKRLQAWARSLLKGEGAGSQRREGSHASPA